MALGVGTPGEAVISVMGHDAEQVFCLGPALDERFVEGCPERIGEDDPDRRHPCGASGSRVTTGGSSWRTLKGGVDVRSGRS